MAALHLAKRTVAATKSARPATAITVKKTLSALAIMRAIISQNSQIGLFDAPRRAVRHDGPGLTGRDQAGLSTVQARAYEVLQGGRWITLADLAERIGATESGASARLRDFRKPKFRALYPNGGIEKRRVSGRLYEYRMVPA